MSITDELRKWAEDNTTQGVVLTTYPPQHAVRGALETLLRIADRIDAEHERRSNEQYACGAEDGISASIEALVIQTHGFIELPKDADGEYIQPSDIPILIKVTDGRRLAFCPSLELRQDGTWRLAGWSLDRYRISKPTVEDVLREFAAEFVGCANCVDDHEVTDAIEQYAAKLRLAGDEE